MLLALATIGGGTAAGLGQGGGAGRVKDPAVRGCCSNMSAVGEVLLGSGEADNAAAIDFTAMAIGLGSGIGTCTSLAGCLQL